MGTCFSVIQCVDVITKFDDENDDNDLNNYLISPTNKHNKWCCCWTSKSNINNEMCEVL